MHPIALPEAAPSAATSSGASVTPSAAPPAARRRRPKAPTCGDCFFAAHGLCALPSDGPCPTFRRNHAQGLMPPQQPALLPLDTALAA